MPSHFAACAYLSFSAIARTPALSLLLLTVAMQLAYSNCIPLALIIAVFVQLWPQWSTWIDDLAIEQVAAASKCMALIKYNTIMPGCFPQILSIVNKPTGAIILRNLHANRIEVRDFLLERCDRIQDRALAGRWIEDAEKRWEKAEAEKEVVENKLGVATAKIAEANEKISEYAGENRILQEEKCKMETALQKTIGEQEEEINAQKKEIAAAKYEIEARGASLNNAEHEVKQWKDLAQQRIAAEEDEKRGLLQRIRELEARNARLDADHLRLNDEVNRAYEQIFELEQSQPKAEQKEPEPTTHDADPVYWSGGSGNSSHTSIGGGQELLHQPDVLWPGASAEQLAGVDQFVAAGHTDDPKAALGDGGCGAVRLWRDPRSGGKVFAAKMINMKELTSGDDDWQSKTNIRNAVWVAGKCQRREADYLMNQFGGSPYVVPVHLFRVHPNGYSMTMIMDKMDGTAASLARNGKLDSRSGLDFLEQVANALAYIHSQGVFHDDIKGENIGAIEQPSGGHRFVLMDFGIAVSETEINKDGENPKVGAPGYMAPEVCKSGLMSGKADVFSMFITLANLFKWFDIGTIYSDDDDEYFAMIKKAMRTDKRVADWADMANENPDNRPSAEDVAQRACMLRKLGETCTGYDVLWTVTEDRNDRNEALTNMFTIDGSVPKGAIVMMLKNHLALRQPIGVSLNKTPRKVAAKKVALQEDEAKEDDTEKDDAQNSE